MTSIQHAANQTAPALCGGGEAATFVGRFLEFKENPPTPSQTELRRARGGCCAWPGPLLTTVELHTKSLPQKVNHGGKTFNECEIHKKREKDTSENLPDPLTRQVWGHKMSHSELSWLI